LLIVHPVRRRARRRTLEVGSPERDDAQEVAMKFHRSVLAAVFVLAAGGTRAQVTFEIGSAVAAPGETDVTVPFSILMEPGTTPIPAWSVAIQYDPAVMGGVRIESARETDCFLTYGQEFFYEPGTVGAAFGYLPPVPEPGKGATHMELCPDLDPSLQVRESGAVGTIRFCVLPDAPPGIHVIGYAFWDGGPDRISVHTHFTGMDGWDAPSVLAGFVEVAGESEALSSCTADIHELVRPVKPVPYDAAFRLQGGTALRGGDLVVPFFVEADVEIGSFTLSIDFDEEVLEATEIEKAYVRPDGKDWSFSRLQFDNSNRIPGNAGIEEGFLVGGAVVNLQKRDELPPGKEYELLRFHFRVKPDAALGETLLRFVDGAYADGTGWAPFWNAVQGGYTDIPPNTEATPTLILGRINILPDGALFVRGDSNGDDHVNLSDPIATLGYLFLGGSIWCQKAADADDDGTIEIDDPILTLHHLFQGGDALPPPAAPGADPTPDALADCPR